MKGKVKQTIGGLRKSVRAAGVGFSTLAASFFMSVQAYAAGVEDRPDCDGHRAVDW